MDGVVQIDVVMRDGDSQFSAASSGNGPISAFIAILQDKGAQIRLLDYVEHTLSAGGDALAAAYIELEVDGNVLWGVGIDGDIATASLKALISSTNRALRTAVTS
jgi:2-isopropylmalate synthase